MKTVSPLLSDFRDFCGARGGVVMCDRAIMLLTHTIPGTRVHTTGENLLVVYL